MESPMRTGNPALNANTFVMTSGYQGSATTMTIEGTVNKSFFFLAILSCTAFFSYGVAMGEFPNVPVSVNALVIGGALSGFILAMITVFKKHLAMYTGTLYAAFKGIFVGAFSGIMEMAYPGIVGQAVFLTFGVFMALLMTYRSGLIPVTQNFRLGVAAATGGIFLLYLATFLLQFAGINFGFIHEGSMMGIGFSIFVVIIASLNLVLDFDFIESGAERGAPKYMEWYAAFGLLVTLVWLYIEILRLLAKTRRR